MNIQIKEISEKKWFNLYDVTDDLTTEEFIQSLTPKTQLNILIQYIDKESIGLYGVIKGKGLYGFTMVKHNFFNDFKNIQIKIVNHCGAFIINSTQNINSFINILLDFFKQNNINLTNDINLVYFQEQIINFLN